MKRNVKYLTSLALTCRDIHDEVKHVQITIVQDLDSLEMGCYFDVVDPSKVKLADELPGTDNA